MRQLTAKQKKILDTLPNTVTDFDDIPMDIIEKLEKINNTEILWSECNRYLSDRPKTVRGYKELRAFGGRC